MAAETLTLVDERGRTHTVEMRDDRHVVVDGQVFRVQRWSDGSLRIEEAPGSSAWAVASGPTRWVFLDGHVYTFETARSGPRQRRTGGHHEGLTAPMPATVLKIYVAAGDSVRRNDVVVVLEAMKMELPVRAPDDGVVAAVNCREGELVQPGVTLVEFED